MATYEEMRADVAARYEEYRRLKHETDKARRRYIEANKRLYFQYHDVAVPITETQWDGDSPTEEEETRWASWPE